MLLFAVPPSAALRDGNAAAATAALQQAIHGNDLTEAATLLRNGAPQVLPGKDQSALMVAAHMGSCKAAKLLTSHSGFEVNLKMVQGEGKSTALVFALKALEGALSNPRSSAVQIEGFVCVVRTVLRHGADPLLGEDERMRTPLMLAASTRHPGVLAAVLRAVLRAHHNNATPLLSPASSGPFESRSPIHILLDVNSMYVRVCTNLFKSKNHDDMLLKLESRMVTLLAYSRVDVTNGWFVDDEGRSICDADMVRTAVASSAVANLQKVATILESELPTPEAQNRVCTANSAEALSLSASLLQAAVVEANPSFHEEVARILHRILGVECGQYPSVNCVCGEREEESCAEVKEEEEEVTEVAVVDVADFDVSEFVSGAFAKRTPLLVRGGAEKWKCVTLGKDGFIKEYGDANVSVAAIPYAQQYGLAAPTQMTISEYFAANTGTDYAFENSLHKQLGTDLGGLYSLWTAMPRQMHNPPQLSIGKEGTGSPPHLHQDAVNGVCVGRKRWQLWPPATAFLSTTPAAEFFKQQTYGKPLEVMQEAGDLLYVPHAWGHAVLNEAETTIGIAVEYHRSL